MTEQQKLYACKYCNKIGIESPCACGSKNNNKIQFEHESAKVFTEHCTNKCDHIIGWNDSEGIFFRNNSPLRQSEYDSWLTTNPAPNPFMYCPDCGVKINES